MTADEWVALGVVIALNACVLPVVFFAMRRR